LLGLMAVSCKTVELSSCDIDVYHDGSISSHTLEKAKDEAYFERNWNINFINEQQNEDNRRQSSQFAVLRVERSTDTVGYREVSMFPNRGFCLLCDNHTRRVSNQRAKCGVSVKVSSTEIKKSKTYKSDKSKETGYSKYTTAQSLLPEVCEDSALSVIKKLPTCSLK
ncbi:MAG: hypothetical protein KC478_11760, partial [Bacteriovoracaceae bacterium]|nr:hypothetical protein [Bacteriovoracaceae bacterium]